MKSRWILLLLIPGLIVVAPISAQAAKAKCFGKPATIVGTPGDDHLVGTSKDDVIVGLGGNDTILARGGYDLTCAGPGDDIIKSGAGPDDSAGGSGNDKIYAQKSKSGLFGIEGMIGNAGNDVFDGGGPGPVEVSYNQAQGPVRVDLAKGTATGEGTDTLKHIDSVLGSRFSDVLKGTNRFNFIAGGGRSDRISGRRGADDLEGEGFHALHGFNGSQPSFAPSGSDIIKGGRGPDFIFGNQGRDTLWAGPGKDFRVYGGRGRDMIVGGSGRDRFLAGNAGNDTVLGRAGADRMLGQRGDDVLKGGRGRDSAEGGHGRDTCRAERRNGCERR